MAGQRCERSPLTLTNPWTERHLPELLQPHLETECILTFPHGNFCSISLRRLWWVCEECARGQKCGSAPGWPRTERERKTKTPLKKAATSPPTPPTVVYWILPGLNIEVEAQGAKYCDHITKHTPAACQPAALAAPACHPVSLSLHLSMQKTITLHSDGRSRSFQYVQDALDVISLLLWKSVTTESLLGLFCCQRNGSVSPTVIPRSREEGVPLQQACKPNRWVSAPSIYKHISGSSAVIAHVLHRHNPP